MTDLPIIDVFPKGEFLRVQDKLTDDEQAVFDTVLEDHLQGMKGAPPADVIHNLYLHNTYADEVDDVRAQLDEQHPEEAENTLATDAAVYAALVLTRFVESDLDPVAVAHDLRTRA